MRAQAASRLAPFGGRASVAAFDLGGSAWWPLVAGVDAVVSSLAVHHLDGPGKRRLFEVIGARLSSRGTLLLADLVEPQRAEAAEVFAAGWDRAAERQAQAPSGSARALEEFRATRWNIFRYPDPTDMPSPLADQLQWLTAAGFLGVDCFWLRAGHAIYGGYRARHRSAGVPLALETALRAADACLETARSRD
jgi:tRNA (cmo5U34)-methyltransferase